MRDFGRGLPTCLMPTNMQPDVFMLPYMQDNQKKTRIVLLVGKT